MQALHLLRAKNFNNLDRIVRALSKGGVMCKVTGHFQLDFNMFKEVIWCLHQLASHYHNIHLPIKAKILNYRPRKTLLSNCLFGLVEVRSVFECLRCCMYHPQMNQLCTQVKLEEMTEEVIKLIALYVNNL